MCHQIDISGLTGYGRIGTVTTDVPGEAPLSQRFGVSFGDDGPSTTVPFDATAAQLQAALQELPSVDSASVERAGPFAGNGYQWTVMVKRSRRRTRYGYVVDEGGNNSPIRGYTVGLLAGTNARVEVESVFGSEQADAYQRSKMGSSGEATGAVYVYRPQHAEAWAEKARPVD